MSSAPLRVAIFGESYLPYLSGVTIASESLARGLAAAGHEPLLLMPSPREPMDAEPPPGVDVAWLPSYQGPPPAPRGYRMPLPVPSRALARARAFQPQIVHAQSPFVSGLMARRTARATGAGLVFTHHTRFGDYRHYLGPLAAPGAAALRGYLRRFWAGCDAIVAPGSELAAEISGQVTGLRRPPLVRSIPTGLDLAAIRSLAPVDPRPAAGWPEGSVVVVSVGRLAREKSVDLLLRAFARAASGDARLRLLLIGGGPLRGELGVEASSAPLRDRVRLAGQLPHADALALAAGCDLFAFASRTETQGLVIAEALACGLPVVSLEGPGVRDAVRDGVDGLVVERGRDEEATERLAATIAALAADPARRARLAAEAREGAGRFDLDGQIERVLELYREAIDRRRGAVARG